MRLSGAAACRPPTALVQPLLLLALLTALLARPVVAAPPAYAVNSMPCPSGPGDIVTVPAGSNLSDVFAANGTGKTYLLEPGSYTMSEQISAYGGGRVGDDPLSPQPHLALNTSWARGVRSDDLLAGKEGQWVVATEDSTTCFIGAGGSREDVVITTTFSTFSAFLWYSDNGAQIKLGLKGFTLNGNGAAAGVDVEGNQAGWAMQDVAIQDTVGYALSSDKTLSGELVDVAVERHTGANSVVYLNSDPTQAYHWRNLTVADCTARQGLLVQYANFTLSGHLKLARIRGLALQVRFGTATFTGNVVIEGNESGAFILSSIIRFEASSTLLVQNNVAPSAGASPGFYVIGTTLSVLGDARFINNTGSGSGGALYAGGSSNVDFSSVQFIGNTAAGNVGGAVSASGGAMTFTSALFEGNAAGIGGAVYAGGSRLNFGSAEFTSNTAGENGGALLAGGTPINIGSARFTRNTAGTEGGAVFTGSSPVNFGSAEFTSNTAGGDGGAVWVVGQQPVNFGSAHFTRNTAGGDGGAVWAGNCPLNFGSAQFTSNTASRDGGALWLVQSSVDFASVCITQNVAGGVGSGILLAQDSSVDFTTPGDARMGANSPLESTVVVGPGSSWTCAGSGAARGAGNYSIEGGPCACADASSTGEGSSSTCTCPAPTPVWYSAACECRVCEPGSGPCCSDTAEFAPCTRSVTFVPDNIMSPFCDGVELLVVVTDTTATGSSPLGQPAETVPAVDVPVVFGVSGDCEPSVQARTVRTDAQGRARVRMTARGPGVVAVVAAVTSGGSLPRQVVLATSHIKFLSCGHDREHAFDDFDDEHDGYARRPGYDHARSAHRYAADDDVDDDDVVAEAFEAAATQMALQALKEEGQQAVGQAAVSRRTV